MLRNCQEHQTLSFQNNWEEKKQKIKSNREFWIPKIERNIQRDLQNSETLKNEGWKVLRFWDSQIKKEFGSCLFKILEYIDYVEDYK